MEDLFDKIIITIALLSAVLAVVLAFFNETWALVFLCVFGVAMVLFSLKQIWK